LIGKLLHDPNLTLSEIAERAGVTPACVGNIQRESFPELRAGRYRSSRGSHVPEAIQERRVAIRNLLLVKPQLPYAEIGRRLGLLGSYVEYICKSHFPELRRPSKTRGPSFHWAQDLYASPVKRYWVSSVICTVQVNLGADGKICWSAPVVAKFQGETMAHLCEWLRRKSGGGQVLVEEL